MAAVQGTDVSVIQGVVPYDALKKDGHSFTFIRCKVGNNPGIDARFIANARAAKSAGLFAAPYFFPFPLAHLDPREQAATFVEAAMIDDHPLGSEPGELPPAFDLEWPPPEEWGKRGCTPDQIVDWSIACLEETEERYQRELIIYSYPYELKALSVAKNYSRLVTRKLWIAGGSQYLNGDGHVPDLSREQPPKVAGWGDNWLFWQHDGNGGKRLPSGADADFNVYRYDAAALERLAQMVPEPSKVDVLDATTIHAMASDVAIDDMLHAYRQERAQRMLEDAT